MVSLEGAGLSAQGAHAAEGLESEEDDEALQQQRRYFIEFWTEFLEGLRLDDQSQPVPGPARGQNLYFAMPSGSKAWVSAYVVRSRQRVGVFLTFDRGPLAERMFQEFKQDAAEIESAIGGALDWEDEGQGKYRILARQAFPDVADVKYRPAILAWLRDKANRFISVFRPRLERFVRETQ